MVIQPYPGTTKISAKELTDAPKVALDQEFFRRLNELQEVIKDARPRYINDSVVNSNVLGILAGSYLTAINRNHRLIVEKWYVVYLLQLVGSDRDVVGGRLQLLYPPVLLSAHA